MTCRKSYNFKRILFFGNLSSKVYKYQKKKKKLLLYPSVCEILYVFYLLEKRWKYLGVDMAETATLDQKKKKVGMNTTCNNELTQFSNFKDWWIRLCSLKVLFRSPWVTSTIQKHCRLSSYMGVLTSHLRVQGNWIHFESMSFHGNDLLLTLSLISFLTLEKVLNLTLVLWFLVCKNKRIWPDDFNWLFLLLNIYDMVKTRSEICAGVWVPLFWAPDTIASYYPWVWQGEKYVPTYLLWLWKAPFL